MATSSRPLRWATIGYGGAFNMGKQHFDAARVAGIEPVAVCDVDPKRTEAAAKDFPGIRTYQKVEDLLRDPNVDGVTAILPHNLHGPVGLQVVEAGKHLVMEKPFVTKVAEADAMIAAAKKKGVMLTVYHNRRWDGDFTRFEEIVRAGQIGDIFQIDTFFGGFTRPPGNWWRDDKQISGGLLLDWGAHFLFWINRLMPLRIVSVDGFLHKRRWQHVTNEEHGLVIVRYEGGKTATYEQSQLAAVGKPQWRILGTQGAIESVVLSANGERGLKLVRIGDDLKRHEEWLAFNPTLTFDAKTNPFYHNVVAHILKGEPLEITAEEARRVIAILEAAETASRKGAPQPLA